ncbi:MAG: prolyl-tRNA synthetase associated domain-containing protein [Leptotrichiaceae bacterium]|nr:prolyl-tRNA synthetase associated domain-containing protein [Leptotrichiaceae bacterium]
MEEYEKVYKVLNKLSIPFEIIEHPAAMTTEEADKYVEGIEGVLTKSLFLTNNKKTAYYLLIMDDRNRLDMEKFTEITGEKRLKFASSESLFKKMGLQPGTVSIFGLINNSEKDINIYFETEILKERRMSFHPNDNTKTLFLLTEDILKFIISEGFEYKEVNL